MPSINKASTKMFSATEYTSEIKHCAFVYLCLQGETSVNMSCCFLVACEIKFGLSEAGSEINLVWGKNATKINKYCFKNSSYALYELFLMCTT